MAIDGPAGAGKSTVARELARRLGFIYIDTGAMYRAVALWALRAGVSDADHHKLEQLALQSEVRFEPGGSTIYLNGEDVTTDIRTPEVSSMASRVSAVAGVRRILVEKQRALGSEISVVMEGRDIGSVVFPEAQVKVFLDAPARVRAERRVNELKDRGAEADAHVTAREIAERDGRDRSRTEAPLVQSADAVYMDSGDMAPDDVVEAILKLVRERTANGKEYKR